MMPAMQIDQLTDHGYASWVSEQPFGLKEISLSLVVHGISSA
jgi:hypothetical protein